MPTGKWAALWSVAFIALLIIAVGGNVLPAQSGTGTPVPEAPVIDNSWPNVNLNVVVLDKHGVPQTVDEHQFRLFEDGAERPLQFRGSPDSPVSLAFIIDSSGSMYTQKPEIVTAVTTILKALPPDSEVMAVLFNDESFLDLPLTPVAKVDLSFLDRFHARGGTALYDTVFATEKHFIAHAKYVRRSMVILSDGIDNASHISMAAGFWAMEQPGAPVIYVCPPYRANFFQTQKTVGLITMSGFAKWGGGVDFNLAPDPATVAATVAAAIRSQMVVQFTAGDAARDGKKHKLELRLQDKGLKVHVLPGYFAPAK